VKQKSKAPRKLNIQITVALIGLAGAVIVALISKFPDLKNIGRITTNDIVSFSKYDDPTGIFSIEFPSNFYVSNRRISADSFAITFLSRSEGDDEDQIHVTAEHYPSENVSENLQAATGFETLLHNESLGLRVISNERTQDGYLLHFEFLGMRRPDKRSYDCQIYSLVEARSNMVINLSMTVCDESTEMYGDDIITQLFSSFQWSAPALQKAFE
jgi:hypothetical protein